ncbi:Hypothetical predicted protein [Podarcis lilfordi]|uniref:Uncharacterized protein n=1 Tax=Podarcis lilfordi TaxID=74358 RepID=A0AA35LGD9_9SAUR|nr:Hypothetical predicted protein [Podarcis lilfordi]
MPCFGSLCSSNAHHENQMVLQGEGDCLFLPTLQAVLHRLQTPQMLPLFSCHGDLVGGLAKGRRKPASEMVRTVGRGWFICQLLRKARTAAASGVPCAVETILGMQNIRAESKQWVFQDANSCSLP